MKKSYWLFLVLSILALPTSLVAQGSGSPNVQFLANLNSYSSVGYNDCWGYTAPDGREYALLGVANGTSIVDITDAPTLNEIAFIPSNSSSWKDIKTYRNYAYAVNESGGGLQIIDLSNLPISATLAGTYSGFTTSHNIYIDTANAILYAEGASAQPVRAISLADPLNPVQLSTFGIECHDIYARNNIAYVSEGSSGSIGVYDLTTPGTPALVKRFPIPNPGYVHNAWLSDDGNYLMTTEETTNKTIKMWDISDINNPVIVSNYLAGPGFLAHNTHIKGRYAYISHYTDGLRIVDVSDPNNTFEEGYYDTWLGTPGGFDGAWGAFPFFASGKVLISDISTGLYVVFFAGAVDADSLDPNPPEDASAYSDYLTPTSVRVRWTDPSSLFGGGPISPSDFTIEIIRDSSLVASVPGGTQEFMDNGLVDGTSYSYTIYAKIIATDSTSRKVQTSWIAGGSPIPRAPTNIGLNGNASAVRVFWQNPSSNVDGTPMDDLAGVRLYQDGALVATYARASADTSLADSADYTPSTPGNYRWHVTAIDNELIANESAPSLPVFSPLSIPFEDHFITPGIPDALVWINDDADVDNRSVNPPTSPYALNLNAMPDGGDQVDLRPVDLTGLEASGVSFLYSYQPQGTGNAPETADSLLVYFKNNVGTWVQIRGYAGMGVQAFQTVTIPIVSAPNGGGSYFFSQFQVRFKSYGTASTTSEFDDWFIDDVSLTIPTGVQGTEETPREFSIARNYPNPFNPTTNIRYTIPKAAYTKLVVYNLLGQAVRVLVDQIVEPGTHVARWDGTNDAGRQVVSGPYFYRFEAGDFVRTQKMILLK